MTRDPRTCLTCGKTGGIHDEVDGPRCGACGAEVTHAQAAHARGRKQALAEVRDYLAQCERERVYVADVAQEIDRLAKEPPR